MSVLLANQEVLRKFGGEAAYFLVDTQDSSLRKACTGDLKTFLRRYFYEAPNGHKISLLKTGIRAKEEQESSGSSSGQEGHSGDGFAGGGGVVLDESDFEVLPPP